MLFSDNIFFVNDTCSSAIPASWFNFKLPSCNAQILIGPTPQFADHISFQDRRSYLGQWRGSSVMVFDKHGIDAQIVSAVQKSFRISIGQQY